MKQKRNFVVNMILLVKIFVMYLAVHMTRSYVFQRILGRFGSISISKATFNQDDIAESDTFNRLTQSYLQGKLHVNGLEDDPKHVDKQQLQLLIKSLLPPVTQVELEGEVDALLKHLEKSATRRISSILADNSYWREAGSLVVMELMFLDCLNSFYLGNRKILADEEFCELKDLLTWEGSTVASLTSKEAHFITAVAATKRGEPIITDAEYMELMVALQAEGSAVVQCMMDLLENVGTDTYLAYLHRSL